MNSFQYLGILKTDKEVLLFFIIICFSPYSHAFESVTENKVELVGLPYKNIYRDKEHIYSRNVWDIKAYKGRLFFGAGNSKNTGPSPNSGPLEVISYDIKTKQMLGEGLIREEQINRFNIINEELYIPGEDATQNWEFGNFYLRQATSWKQFRNIPGALHVYDLFAHDEKMFAAVWINKQAAIAISPDTGSHWQMQPISKGIIRNFVTVGKKIYAVKGFRIKKQYHLALLQFEKDHFVAKSVLNFHDIFPLTTEIKQKIRILNIESVLNQIVYIPAFLDKKTTVKPFGIYVAEIALNNKVLSNRLFMGAGEVARDIIKHQQRLYVLSTKKQNSLFVNRVYLYDSKDSRLNKIIEFTSAAFARSFERYQHYFYFGLGSDINDKESWSLDELSPDTGKILRIRVN